MLLAAIGKIVSIGQIQVQEASYAYGNTTGIAKDAITAYLKRRCNTGRSCDLDVSLGELNNHRGMTLRVDYECHTPDSVVAKTAIFPPDVKGIFFHCIQRGKPPGLLASSVNAISNMWAWLTDDSHHHAA